MVKISVALAVFIDKCDAALAFQYGVSGLSSGWNSLTLASAQEIVSEIDRAIISGIIYAKNQKQMRSLRRQIVFAFGPDNEN